MEQNFLKELMYPTSPGDGQTRNKKVGEELRIKEKRKKEGGKKPHIPITYIKEQSRKELIRNRNMLHRTVETIYPPAGLDNALKHLTINACYYQIKKYNREISTKKK